MTYGGKIAPSPVTAAKAESVSNSIRLTFDVTADKDDKKAYGYMLLASKDASLLKGINYSDIPDGVVSASVLTGSLKVGDDLTGIIEGLEFETQYHTAVVAFDYRRNYSSLSPVYTVTTQINNPPVISTDYEGDYKIKSHETVEVIYVVSEPDGHAVTVTFDAGSEAVTWKQTDKDVYTAVFTGNAADPGSYKAVITVADAYGETAVMEIPYEILENRAPVIVKDIEDVMFQAAGQKLTLDMNEYLSDPDGETLKYQISITDKTVLHINPSENMLHATTLGYGLTDVVIVASDSRGLTCTLTFKVLVKDPSTPVSIYRWQTPFA